jgi:hypothetical protein
MPDDANEELDDLIGVEEASRMLEVAPDRVQVMVDEGLLTPAESGDGKQFLRAEVLAVREIGG